MVSLTREERRARDCLEGHRPFATRRALRPHRLASAAADSHCSRRASSACHLAGGWVTALTWRVVEAWRETRSLTSMSEACQDKAPCADQQDRQRVSGTGTIWQRCYQKAVGTGGSAGCGGWPLFARSVARMHSDRGRRAYIVSR
jgi:hypothetical protein